MTTFGKIGKPGLWGLQFDVEVSRTGARMIKNDRAGLMVVRNELYEGLYGADLGAITVVPSCVFNLFEAARFAFLRIDVNERGVARGDMLYLPADELAGQPRPIYLDGFSLGDSLDLEGPRLQGGGFGKPTTRPKYEF